MSDQKTSIGRVVASVVDVQQTMALQFDSLSKGMEALKLEHQTGISQLREEMRRADDRSQKQLSEMGALHSKELERLHQIIHTLLTRDANALGASAAIIPSSQLQHQQQLFMLQRQMEMVHAQAQVQAQAQAQAQAQVQAQQAQNQAMASLMSVANGVPKPIVPVQQPMLSTSTPQFKPFVPIQPVPATFAPKPNPPIEVTIPSVKPPVAPVTSVDEKSTSAVESEKSKPAISVPVNATFSFGGTSSVSSIFGKKSDSAAAVSPVVVSSAKDDDEDSNDDNYEPQGDFKPVIPLPDLVEVKTGEEGEQAVFNNRAKLYIYANEINEWKERGTGELKLLYNKDKKSYRVVMRRDQVLKVCANFPIVGSMSIKQMNSNEKAYTWFCEDFSEDEPAHVKLSARFANTQIATEFKNLFEKAVAEHKTNISSNDKPIKTDDLKKEVKTEVKEEIEIQQNTNDVGGFGDKFKPKPGSWECSGCYVTCKPEATECACCGRCKDGSFNEKNIFAKPSILQPSPGTRKVTFGFGASATPNEQTVQPAQFGASLNGSPSTSGSIFGGGTPKGNSSFGGGSSTPQTFSFNKPVAPTSAATPTFNFNKLSSSTSPVAASTTGNSLFGGGLAKSNSVAVAAPSFSFPKSSDSSVPKPIFAFGKQSAATASPSLTEEKKQEETPKKVFGDFSSGGATFATLAAKGSGSIFNTENVQKAQQELASQKKTSVFGKKSASPNDTEDATEDGAEEYEPDVDFKPVIPLPDLIEVKTGEEDEEVTFTAKCKLYKYHSDLQENKERGLGDIKLLKSKDNKYRIVMRREQVHKLCANFRIDKTIKLNPKPNAPNVLTFMCQDFSENPNKGDTSIFTAKFKDEPTASSFKSAVQKAQATMP